MSYEILVKRTIWVSVCPTCLCVDYLSLHGQALGKLGGKVKSEAKAAASRKNGKLGGRPRKQQPAKSA